MLLRQVYSKEENGNENKLSVLKKEHGRQVYWEVDRCCGQRTSKLADELEYRRKKKWSGTRTRSVLEEHEYWKPQTGFT